MYPLKYGEGTRTNAPGIGSVPGKEEERQMFQQMQAMAQKQVLIIHC